MTRIPKVKRWRCRHTWSDKVVVVEAPTRFLAKLEAGRRLGIPVLWCNGEFEARPLTRKEIEGA